MKLSQVQLQGQGIYIWLRGHRWAGCSEVLAFGEGMTGSSGPKDWASVLGGFEVWESCNSGVG